MAKKKKVNKETRRLIESISDMIKLKKNNTYRFKGVKKKTVREVKRTCLHWIIRKGELKPAVEKSPDNPDFFRCRICGKQFPMVPLSEEEYKIACDSFANLVDQAAYYSVHMGGDASDTKVFIKLKELIPKFSKIVRNEIKHLNKHNEFEARRESDSGSQFDRYSAFNYVP